MGFYTERIVPWLIHWTMGNKEAARLRRGVVLGAHGRVLEVGIGSGRNLPLYPDAAAAVAGLDPSPVLLGLARQAGARVPFALVQGSAEAIPFDAGSFDSVVMTWTLCSIPDPVRALAEIRRVLKPGGELLFIEHGRAADPGVARWQDRVNPLWRRVSGGCNLDRDAARLMRAAGFAFDRLETGYLARGPRILTYMFQGRARAA